MYNEYKEMIEKQKNMSPRQRADYQNEQRNKLVEQQALSFIKDGILHLFVAGGAGSRIPEQDNLAFTNAGVVLNAIYGIYIEYPELNVDDLLEQALIELLNGEIGYFYTALNTIDVQLYNEKIGASPFKIDNPQVFLCLKDNIKRNSDYLKSSSAYKGRLYANKLYGFAEDVDQKIEEQKGIKVL